MQSGHTDLSAKLDLMEGAALESKLVGDIDGTFRVARYQRGYRWGKFEVECLLNDIWNSGGKPYSLQPVVVKHESEGVWELIDGQQRLTTLYLIFQFMIREGLQKTGARYNITYETRPNSESYLRELDKEKSESNIDFHYLYEAYVFINGWFKNHGHREQFVANKFHEYLFENVRIIWYQAPKSLNSINLFTRLNIGRIPLTNAELFKALLLSSSSPENSYNPDEVAVQWDNIERSLQMPDLWAFIADDEMINTPTHINILLYTLSLYKLNNKLNDELELDELELDELELDRLSSGHQGPEYQRFHIFDKLTKMVKIYGAQNVWDQVIKLHELILGWYENRDYYHKIGYLIAIGHSLPLIVSLAKNKTKSEFINLINREISDSLSLSKEGIENLRYGSGNEKAKCAQVLFLMNVETIRKLQNSSERYSFRIHREEDWSLEHIHAQNTEQLTKVEQWKEWLRLHREALINLPSIDAVRQTELLERIDAVADKIEGKVFNELAREITIAFSDNTSHDIHALSNLALLSSDNNSALSNSVFEVKRRRILKLDRAGAYIPICTRQVFLKYYTDADAQQIHCWSQQDRKAYLDTILSPESGIGAYLNKQGDQ